MREVKKQKNGTFDWDELMFSLFYHFIIFLKSLWVFFYEVVLFLHHTTFKSHETALNAFNVSGINTAKFAQSLDKSVTSCRLRTNKFFVLFYPSLSINRCAVIQSCRTKSCIQPSLVRLPLILNSLQVCCRC